MVKNMLDELNENLIIRTIKKIIIKIKNIIVNYNIHRNEISSYFLSKHTTWIKRCRSYNFLLFILILSIGGLLFTLNLNILLAIVFSYFVGLSFGQIIFYETIYKLKE
jgi:hypothetical protein